MKNFDKLEPKRVWAIFREICSIGHPSGHEEKLAAAIAGRAEERGLAVRRDSAGNLRIDRPAAPGFENAPAVLLQAHLDMVPQAAPGVAFDFLNDPIPPVVKEGWVVSAAGTTLGADDGIGVAAALALLFDADFRCGPIAVLLTVSEEVGLNGAQALPKAFLAGKFLLNLDSEEEGELCVGCAGGARLDLELEVPFEPVPAGMAGVSAEIRNLAGGHSGMNIGDRRGNAVRFLGELLTRCPELRVGRVSGGTLDNVIPRSAAAWCAIDPELLPAVRTRAAHLAVELAATFDAPADFRIELHPAELPERVWEAAFQKRLAVAVAGAPDGVFTRDFRSGQIETSSNLAALRSEGGALRIRTSQRSFSDAERERATRRLIDWFAPLGAKPTVDSSYPGWAPEWESPLLQEAVGVYRELFGAEPVVKVIHAGLECGILRAANPELQLISFGPTLENAHSPSERLEIASVPKFDRFLRELVGRIARMKGAER